MKPVRKIIGALIILIFAIPLLVAMIWTVGVTKAAVSPELISDLPREIIAELPNYLDEVVKEAQDVSVIEDEETRAWFEALSKVRMTPKELLEKVGITDWMEQELSKSLQEIGEVLRGQREPDPVMIDMRPLKKALDNEEIDLYLMDVLQNLPPCDEEGTNRWLELRDREFGDFELPACRPDMDVARIVLQNHRIEVINDMQDEIQIFEGVRFMPFGFSKTVVWLSYLLFLLPLIFLFLGSVIGGTSAAGFFRWFGVSTFAGGLIPLTISLFAEHITKWAIRFAPYSHTEEWSSDLGLLILDKIDWIPTLVVEKLFSPVTMVAGIVCIIGVIFFILSFPFRKN
ncbi:MAG: hypothetical protein KAX11_01395 [Candidatus Aminicenantes bacterium]|nr:hypothetical protein [Candidatus Aminicenantes bacterium]